MLTTTVPVPPSRRRSAVLAGAVCVMLSLTGAPALAQTPSPQPSGPGATAGPATGDPTPTATPQHMSTPSPTPEASTTPAPTARPAPKVQAEADDEELSLQVAALDSPQPGRFFQDLGRYGFRGSAGDLAEGHPVEIYRRTAGTGWAKVAATTVQQGAYATSRPVTAKGAFSFAATTGGAPGSGDEGSSPVVRVAVADSRIVLDRPTARVDSLRKPSITGSVVPARAGVPIRLSVRRSGTYRLTARAVTDSRGRFTVRFGYGRGRLATYRVRTTFHAVNRDRWEPSTSRTLRRVAVLNADVSATTAADVDDTYRKGCPVGRSKLSTVRMNYYGRDRRMHRGVLITRTDLVPEMKRAFGAALDARYPFARLRNPNAYGGNDPRQMAANNTSGFNCRKVVGNPYAQSPHSYGIAIDVSPVQNPYRDRSGKWWPADGLAYVDRTPLRRGMLGASSTLTRQLASDDFFWGGRWSPGRDYQHFEYRP